MMHCTRRDFIKLGLTGATASLIPDGAMAALDILVTPVRHLSFYNTHTNEHLDTCYFRQGAYCTDALRKINTILRDHRTGAIKPIDLQLLDVLHALSGRINRTSPIHIISGYRSPRSNARLRQNSKYVASRSLHMQGKAIDLRVPGFNTERLKSVAISMQAGGVGHYPGRDFVHIDTGRVRCW